MEAARHLRQLKNLLVADEVRYRVVQSGPCRGCQLPLNLRHEFRTWLGLYEIELRKILRACVRPGDCCYDVGAASGYYTLALATLAAPGKVLAIEAENPLYDRLRETVARNSQVRSAIETLRCCVSDAVEAARCRVTLDHVVLELGYPPPNFIKLDVEGAEHAALLGAREILRRHAPRWIVEVHSAELEKQCRTLLEQHGYEVSVIERNRLLPEYRPLVLNRWIYARKEQNGSSPANGK
jgi:precorrin-6B methylase 2